MCSKLKRETQIKGRKKLKGDNGCLPMLSIFSKTLLNMSSPQLANTIFFSFLGSSWLIAEKYEIKKKNTVKVFIKCSLRLIFVINESI